MQDWGLDEDWLQVARRRAAELQASALAADALRADAANRRDLIMQQRAKASRTS